MFLILLDFKKIIILHICFQTLSLFCYSLLLSDSVINVCKCKNENQ